MKRHPALEPFSRDHNDGLILARNLELDRDGAIEAMRLAWNVELEDHFAEEERLLIPLASEAAADRLRAEHEEIARRVQRLPDEPEALGVLLRDHIRWEERVLFVEIEKTATEAQLATLAEQTDALELRRHEHDAQRKRLVRRRRGLD